MALRGSISSQWQSGAKYFEEKAGIVYNAIPTNMDIGDIHLPNPTEINSQDAAISSSYLCGRTPAALHPGFFRGNSWIYKTQCSKTVENGNKPEAWAAPPTIPPVCTDSEPSSQRDTVTNIVYVNDVLRVATMNVAVTLMSVTGTEKPNAAEIPLRGDLRSNYSDFQWVGTGVNHVVGGCSNEDNESSIKAWTQDKQVSCETYDFGVGRGSAVEDTNAAVEFHRCKLPKSYKEANNNCDGCFIPAGDCQCSAAGIMAMCPISYHLSDYCMKNTVDKDHNLQGLVLRRHDTYFTVPVDKHRNTVCEVDDGMQNCTFFNGAIRSLNNLKRKASLSVFSEEPNPFVESGKNNDRNIYSVPVELSLFAAAVPPGRTGDLNAGKSYLVRLLECSCETVGTCCSMYSQRPGWQFLEGFYNRLTRVVPDLEKEHAYKRFAALYFGYAAAQVFFLGIYQYTGIVSQNYPGDYNLFLTESQWIETLCRPFYKLEFTGIGMNDGLTKMFIGEEGTSLFTDSLPYVGPLDDDDKVPVEITVPAALFNIVFDGESPNADAVKMLLLRLFPVTVPDTGGHGFQPTSYFRSPDDSAKQIKEGRTEPAASPFEVVDVGAPNFFKLGYDNGTLSAIPHSAQQDSTSLVVAATLKCKVKLRFPDSNGEVSAPSMTILFYLFYLLRNSQIAMKQLDHRMFADTKVKEKFEPAPVNVKWEQACVIQKHKMCQTGSHDGLESQPLRYMGTGSYLVNRLFMTPASPTCSCLNGSNLPIHYTNKSLQPYAMCFNSRCNGAPVCLSNILNNLGNRENCDETAANEPYDCSQHCDEYVKVLLNNRTEITDLGSVDFGELERKCGFKALDLVKPLDLGPFFLSGCILAALGIPLLYAVVAGICAAKARGSGGTPFVKSVAANPAFYGSCIAVAVVLAAAAGLVATQLRGEQVCRSTLHTTDGYTIPSSTCRATGPLWDLILGKGKGLDLPQDFCRDPQSYCEWWKQSGSFQTCKIGSGTGCQTEAANGMCSVSKSSPLENRPIRTQRTKIRWTATGVLFSVGLSIAAAPAITALFMLLCPEFPGKIGVAVVVALLVVAACFTLMYLQYLVPNDDGEWKFLVGPCNALTEYPTRLVTTAQPGGVSQAAYELNGQMFNSAPVYELKTSANAAATFAAEANPPKFMFVTGVADGYVMADEIPDAQNPDDDKPILYTNDTGSPGLYTPLNDESQEVPIFADFVAYSPTATGRYTFCGQLHAESTCGSGPECPCAPDAAQAPTLDPVGVQIGSGATVCVTK